MVKNWIRAFVDFRRLNGVSAADKAVVFYSEGRHNWPHLSPIIQTLLTIHKVPVLYVTSELDDPGLHNEHELLQTFFIGDGALRTTWFRSSPAPLTVMTMPDLGTSYIKKSPLGGQYLYIHHSMVSTHMIYNEDAFDHFDYIFCVGPHHIDEIHEREREHNLPPKTLIEHGYGHLDVMLETVRRQAGASSPNKQPEVLIAPSWGDTCLLEHCGTNVIAPLINAGIRTIVRPHPMTKKKSPQVIQQIDQQFSDSEFFKWDMDVSAFESFISSDLLISDWSGAALEYAFAFEKPVLFVDVPPKVRNPNYKTYKAVPVEDQIRSTIGEVVPMNELDALPSKVEAFIKDKTRHKDQIKSVRAQYVFNLNNSASVAADAIVSVLNGSS